VANTSSIAIVAARIDLRTRDIVIGASRLLQYIRELGAGAIWLSPVLRNVGFEQGTYHGYGIRDFLEAEPRFADDPTKADDELRQLVDAAHAEGLYVIFDSCCPANGRSFGSGA
jgi:glycosidase